MMELAAGAHGSMHVVRVVVAVHALGIADVACSNLRFANTCEGRGW